MNDRIVVDPITRIEGHLRIEAQMDGNQIAEAYSSGTMVRGIEIILRNRDPRDAWAFAQRICGGHRADVYAVRIAAGSNLIQCNCWAG